MALSPGKQHLTGGQRPGPIVIYGSAIPRGVKLSIASLAVTVATPGRLLTNAMISSAVMPSSFGDALLEAASHLHDLIAGASK